MKKEKPSEKIFKYHDERMREISVKEDRLIWIPSHPRLLSIEFLFEAILRYLDEVNEEKEKEYEERDSSFTAENKRKIK